MTEHYVSVGRRLYESTGTMRFVVECSCGWSSSRRYSAWTGARQRTRALNAVKYEGVQHLRDVAAVGTALPS